MPEGCQETDILHFLEEWWLSGMDSNHDKGLQRALCYHYTTGHDANKLPSAPWGAKGILGVVRGREL